MNLAQELSCASTLAKRAGALQLAAQQQNLTITTKEDHSPVTNVDRACEKMIRTEILATFPEDGFLGEESGSAFGTSGRCWIVDPLDGTRPFIRGIPTFSTLIALEIEQTPVLGVIHLPALQLTCWATKGSGAFLNGDSIRVSATTDLSQAMGSALGMVEHLSPTIRKQITTLMRSLDYTYGFMDAYSYVLLASGKLDLCVNVLDKPWDCAAAACIITEAGGQFSDINGNQSTHNGSVVFSNRILHKQILPFFQPE